ncbi:unnamed protein product, partial [Mesorhabditis belari]|uniref:Uncharacterized protein n=1 Tax=Mesorhabditis belari TaxID=2138241 RepID=A0AAF3EFM3_9BILA
MMVVWGFASAATLADNTRFTTLGYSFVALTQCSDGTRGSDLLEMHSVYNNCPTMMSSDGYCERSGVQLINDHKQSTAGN